MKYKTNSIRIIINIGIAVLTILSVIISHHYCNYPHIFDDVSAWGTSYTVFGVLYAIIAGFLIIEALSKYNKLHEIIEEEINNLQDIRDLAIYLNCQPEVIKKIIYELKGYAHSVATTEWNRMKMGSKNLDADTTREMYEIFKAINDIDLRDKKDEIALQLLMQKMTDITTLRTKRISTATQKLPYSLKILLYFMSWSLIVGLILMGVYSLFVHIMMIMFLVLSVQLLNTIILDIDDPFEGMWNITPILFVEFANSLESSNQQDVTVSS